MKKTFICIVVMALALLSSVGLAYSAVDILLKIDGINGESVIDGHEDEIDVLSWNWGVTNAGSMDSGTGGGSGRPQVQDISIVKYVDRASPGLLFKCLNGEYLNEAILTVRKAGKDPIEFLVITLSAVTVTSVSTGASGGEDYLFITDNCNAI
jgi:type VI secretion system secreted protein Hcp